MSAASWTIGATVLRGLMSRRLLSVSTLLLLVLAVGGAVLGPLFQQASTTSFTLTRIDEAPAPSSALTWQVQPGGRNELDQLVKDAEAATRAAVPNLYGPAQVTLLSRPLAGLDPPVTVVARDDACATLPIEGVCPRGPREVLLHEDDLGSKAIGDRFVVPRLGPMTITGTYGTPTTTDDWLFPGLLVSLPASATSSARPAPYLVTHEAYATLPPRLWAPTLENRLVVPDQITDAEFDRLVAATELERFARHPLAGTGAIEGDSETNVLPDLLVEVREQRAAARSAVLPAVLALVLVALAMIMRLQAAAAELRAPELALAALRGVGRTQLWLLGVAESWALIALAAPLGLAAGFGAVRVLADQWLRPGLVLPSPPLAVAAGALVCLAGAAVSAAAVGQVLGNTLGGQLAGSSRAGTSRRGVLVAELTVISLAVALPLARLSSDSDGLGTGELLLPVVLAVAAGSLATRTTAALARWWAARGAVRPIVLFIAVRAVARRAQGTVVILPVAASLAVAVFAGGISGIAADWRESVASTRSPAPIVLASPLSLLETQSAIVSLDPKGQWAMAAGEVTLPQGGPVVVVDTSRLARVATWSPQWLAGRDAADVAALIAPSHPVLRLNGERMTLTVQAPGDEADVDFAVVSSSEGMKTVRFGPLGGGVSTVTVATPYCVSGCLLRSVSATADGPDPLRIVELTVDETPITDAGSGAPGIAGMEVSTDGTDVVFSGFDDALPLVAARRALATQATPDGTVLDLTSSRLPVDVRATAESVPLAGPIGVLADLDLLLGRYRPDPALSESQVWLRQDAPAEVREELLGSGMTELTRHEDVRDSLDDEAYAQALRLYRVVAGLILLMGLGGLVVALGVQAPARRRDAAAMRVVGLARRTVGLAAMLELAVVLIVAMAAGLCAGLLAQQLLIGSLSLGVIDDPRMPPVLAQLDLDGAAILTGGLGVVVLTVAAVAAGIVVSRARAASLRESAR